MIDAGVVLVYISLSSNDQYLCLGKNVPQRNFDLLVYDVLKVPEILLVLGTT